MSFNALPAPGKMVGYADLETLALEKAPAIVQDFNADMLTHNGVLGSEFVPNNDCRIYIGWMTPIIAPALSAETLHTPPEQFVRDSMKVAALLADRLLGSAPFKPDTSSLKENLVSVEDFFDRVLVAPMAYLNERDTLHDLLSIYTAPTAESRVIQDRAALLGGFLLLQIERQRYREFQDAQISRFQTELENI